jgi:two-component system LytT family response regulator
MVMSDFPTGPMRALVVDDEAPARSRLRAFLREEPGWELVGECTNGEQALEAIRRERPDLVFLDIRMPRLDGFGVVERLGEDEMPLVVFTTAYDEYAVKAFEVHALDYLLKPFDRERFSRTLARARGRRGAGEGGKLRAEIQSVLLELRGGSACPDRVALKVDGRLVFVRYDEVDWVEAEGNYVKFHLGSVGHLVRETLTWCEQQLPSPRFLRISRSAIVNTDRIREVQPLFSGDQAVLLRDGTKLTLSRNYRERLEPYLGGGR